MDNSHTTVIIKLKNQNYSVYPPITALSVHDVQVLNLPNIILPDDRNEFYFYRKIRKHSLNEFRTSLSYEAWENVFSNNDNDTNIICNNCLNTFLWKLLC